MTPFCTAPSDRCSMPCRLQKGGRPRGARDGRAVLAGGEPQRLQKRPLLRGLRAGLPLPATASARRGRRQQPHLKARRSTTSCWKASGCGGSTTRLPGSCHPPEGQAQHVVGKPVLAAVVPHAEGGGGQRHGSFQRREAEFQALLRGRSSGGWDQRLAPQQRGGGWHSGARPFRTCSEAACRNAARQHSMWQPGAPLPPRSAAPPSMAQHGPACSP